MLERCKKWYVNILQNKLVVAITKCIIVSLTMWSLEKSSSKQSKCRDQTTTWWDFFLSSLLIQIHLECGRSLFCSKIFKKYFPPSKAMLWNLTLQQLIYLFSLCSSPVLWIMAVLRKSRPLSRMYLSTLTFPPLMLWLWHLHGKRILFHPVLQW